MTDKSRCELAREGAAARDAVQATLLTILGERIPAHEREKIDDRISRLSAFFGSLSGGPAKHLHQRLTNLSDPLAVYFDCELHEASRRRLRQILAGRPQDLRRITAVDRGVANRGLAPAQPPGTPAPIADYNGLLMGLNLPRAKLPRRTLDFKPDQPALPRPAPRATIELLELAYAARNTFRADPQTALDAVVSALNDVAGYLDRLNDPATIEARVDAITADRGAMKSTAGSMLGTLYTAKRVHEGVLSAVQEIGRLRRLVALHKAVARKQEFDRLINVIRSNFDFLEVAAGEAISFELARDAPLYRPSLRKNIDRAEEITKPEWRVLHWLRRRRRMIRDAEREHVVDRRAIAAVIAWEALHNVQRATVQSVGPGKMHLYDSQRSYLIAGKKTEAVPQQLERRGYVSRRSDVEREQYLATTRGAIEYIAASMDAAADIVDTFANVGIRNNLGLLTFFYQAKDLKEWEDWVLDHRARIAHVQPKTSIPIWLQTNLWKLERVLGKPKALSK
jgi:hypothetical protein